MSIGRRPVRARWWSAIVLAVAVALGLGLTLWPRSTPVAQAMPMAPNFSLPAASAAGAPLGRGGTLSLRALRGHPVLINFMLSNCGACLDELSLLRRTARTYHKQGLVVLGVDTFGDSADIARRLAAAAHLTYPVVVDNQAVAWQYGVASVPTSFFVDASGRLAGQYIGELNPGMIRTGLAAVGAVACAHCGTLEPLSFDTSLAAQSGFNADFTFAPPRKAPVFAVRDQQGRVITPAALRGKVVALTFISALCRQQCPLIGRTLSVVRQRLGKDAARFAIVAVSVDPEVDSPAATRSFAADSGWSGADWHYLTAPRPLLKRVWAAYYVDVPPPASPIFKPGDTIVHDAGLYLIDPRGRLRAYYNTPFFAPRVAGTVQSLLANT